MKKDDYNKKLFTIISILASVFVYSGAIAIYFYANGWRLGSTNQLFVKTGVLTIESDPFLANIYIDENSKGRTPKSISLPVGVHNISVSRSGYNVWKKNIEVKEEKLTPIFPWLIKKDIEENQPFSLQDISYVNSWRSKESGQMYFLAKEYLSDTLLYRYSLYRFDSNTAFWDNSSHPRVVLTFELPQEPKIEMLLSPNGQYGVITLISPNSTDWYILDATKTSTLDTLTKVNLESLSSYSMTWSNNNRYLMFESNEDLISFDISKHTRSLLIKKLPNEEYLWTTDNHGYFYKLEQNKEDDTDQPYYSYLLIQTQMDGSEPDTLLTDLYFQKNQEYIIRYQDDTGSGKYLPFTSSPESTKSVGKLTYFTVNQDANGIYLETEFASYWYNIELAKYYLISPFKSKLLSFAPNNESLLFKDEAGFNIFRLYKEEGDHTVEIGTKVLETVSPTLSEIFWLSNSINLGYIQDDQMSIVDIDGENKAVVLENTKTFISHTFNSSSNKIFTLSVEPGATEGVNNVLIMSYTIH